jgi:hypothetical protein
MKEQIEMSPKYISILISIFLLIVVFSFLFFIKKNKTHNREIKELIRMELNGRINILENINRGSYNLKIGTYKIHSLPIAFEIEKYNIQIGDSVSKEANSRIIKFYKNKNGVFEKYCEYNILF